jgi:hypothetical protein
MTGAIWPELHATALIGTGRKPWRGASPTGPASDLVAGVGPDYADVLLAAGALTVARRAGTPLTGVTPTVEPAPTEARRAVPPVAATRLRTLLGGTSSAEMLGVWLRLAVDRDLIAPPDQLPALFQVARVQPALQPLVAAVSGARGAWLAALRPEWRFILDAQARQVIDLDPRVWDEGTLPERVAYLASLRGRDPRAGLARLTEVWASEPPAERAAFLAVLETGLNSDDEQLCETALDDRRKEVRAVAADLLGRLPGSAYQGRMAARVSEWVVPTGRRVLVRPPVECDAAMRRDGIEVKPPPGTGERAWWLEQVAAAAPLSVWASIAPDPPAVLAAAIEPGWSTTMCRAWARAAIRFGAPDWAAALIAAGFGSGPNAEIHDTALAASLYDLLPGDTVVDAAIELVTRSSEPDLTRLGRLLDACPTPWPPRLADAMLGYLHQAIRESHPTWIQARVQMLGQTIVNGLALDALAAVVTLADRVRAEADAAGLGQTGGVRLMDSLVRSISDRHTMFQEFA